MSNIENISINSLAYGLKSIKDSDAEKLNGSVKVVGNLVTSIVEGYYTDGTVGSPVEFHSYATRSYVRIPVIGGRKYALNNYASQNFSMWAYTLGENDIIIAKITFPSDYVIQAPSNATVLYLANTGWDADSDIVVMESDVTIYGEKIADHPLGTATLVNIDKQADLYTTIDLFGLYKYNNWQRGNLDTPTDGVSTMTKDTNWTYMSQRICTPPSIPIKLKEGDILSLNGNSDLTYWIDSYNSSTEKWVKSGWISDDYVAPSENDYWVVIRRTDDANISYTTDLSEYFTVKKANGKTKLFEDQIADLTVPKLPNYYYTNNWLKNVIDDINNKSQILNGCVFAFITDLHFSENSQNSKFLLNKIFDATSVPFAIAGGDYAAMYGGATVLQQEYETLLEYANYVGKDRWFAIRGNHDFYNYNSNSDDTRNGYIWAKTYNAIYRNSERWQSNALAQDGCYCIDNDAQKTRIICLNSNDWNLTYDKNENTYYISVAQAQWLLSRLTEKTNWKIIVVSHVPSDSSLSDYHESQDVIQNILIAFRNKQNYSETYKSTALSANFTNTTNTLICHISGHNHKDESHVESNVLSITTTCDAHYLDDGHGAVVGTVTEQAFDVFCINYDTGTINAVRVGRGSDRNWTY